MLAIASGVILVETFPFSVCTALPPAVTSTTVVLAEANSSFMFKVLAWPTLDNCLLLSGLKARGGYRHRVVARIEQREAVRSGGGSGGRLRGAGVEIGEGRGRAGNGGPGGIKNCTGNISGGEGLRH